MQLNIQKNRKIKENKKLRSWEFELALEKVESTILKGLSNLLTSLHLPHRCDWLFCLNLSNAGKNPFAICWTLLYKTTWSTDFWFLTGPWCSLLGACSVTISAFSQIILLIWTSPRGYFWRGGRWNKKKLESESHVWFLKPKYLFTKCLWICSRQGKTP